MATARSSTMDFFESQDRARRNTLLLILYYILAVMFIITGVYAAILIAWNHYDKIFKGLWHPGVFLWVSACVVFIILLGSTVKMISLSKGPSESNCA